MASDDRDFRAVTQAVIYARDTGYPCRVLVNESHREVVERMVDVSCSVAGVDRDQIEVTTPDKKVRGDSIQLAVLDEMERHFISYMPPRRSLLGGGDPGYVSCSCGWSHPATSAHNAHRLHALHTEGKL